MGRKLKIGAITVAVLVTAMAGIAYAVDQSDDKIAEGVTIAGLDVAGMTRDQALDIVRTEVVKPLKKPVVVDWRDAEFVLSPERAKLRVDIEETVDAAFAASEDGNLLTRTWRRVTGGEVNEAITVEPRWSENRVEGFVAEVADQVNREPRDATIEPAVTSLDRVHSSAGLELRQEELVKAIGEQIGQGAVARLEAETDRIRPAVRTRDLVDQYPHYITVDRGGNVLRYFRALKLVDEYPVSTGLPEYPTPTGLYTITSKQVNPDWSVPNSDWAGELAGTVIKGGTAENPLRSRWMGITDGVGIHGTTEVGNLGGPASHGCIRMSVPEVEQLFDLVPTGTPIYIG